VANIILNADPGVSLGSNLDAAPHEIPAGQGRFVQDALLDKPGIARQRGPITNLSTDFPSLPTNARIIGMTSLADPNGTTRIPLLLKHTSMDARLCQLHRHGTLGLSSIWLAPKATR